MVSLPPNTPKIPRNHTQNIAKTPQNRGFHWLAQVGVGCVLSLMEGRNRDFGVFWGGFRVVSHMILGYCVLIPRNHSQILYEIPRNHGQIRGIRVVFYIGDPRV